MRRVLLPLLAVAILLTSTQAVLADDGDLTLDIVVDLQPDPTTLIVSDTNGDGAPTTGEFFSITGNIYEPGTDTDIGDFICRGVWLADVAITALDEAPTVTGGIAGQISQVQQTYVFAGPGPDPGAQAGLFEGVLHVLGTEPGPVMAVAGGTGDFAGASGTLTFEGALGATLDPPFSAADVAGLTETFLSARLTFSISLEDVDDDD